MAIPVAPPPRKLQLQSPASETDVVLATRTSEEARVRDKFSDIYKVSESCDQFGMHDIEDVTDDFSVAGRLSEPKYVKFFESLGASKYVLNTLKNGHKPHLISDVPDFERDNNKSFGQYIDFGMGEIFKLIKDKKVEIVSKKPKIVNPLSVATVPKLRLILDCSVLNKYVAVPSFKMEDYRTAQSLFDKDGYLFSFDLKDGYHHILIDPTFRDYLGFKFEWKGKIYYARYIVAPFGLRDVPYLFTKILRPLVNHWRRSGMKICLYLDDGFSSACNRQLALANSKHVRQDLIRAGIVWNVKKSNWEPVQALEWVGFHWDTVSGCFSVRQKRIIKFKAFLVEMLGLSRCSVRKLAALVGQLVSMLPVLGDVARLKSRNSQIAVASANTWDESVCLSTAIKEELSFWQANLDRFNSRNCFSPKGPLVIDLIEGDASNSGCGSILNNNLVAAKIFNNYERDQSSTHREISNIHFSLISFLDRIRGRSVTFKSDSQSAVRICKVGSMNPVLQYFAEAIFDICWSNSISLSVEWIPRTENQKADAISRLADSIDIDDWGLTDEFFHILNNKWGPYSVDLFANYYNNKCTKFYSLFFSRGSAGVDAFSHNWAGENALLVPPIPLVVKALRHAKACSCKITLVVPFWSSAAFWPVLLCEFSQNIKGWLQVKGEKVLKQGRNPNSLFGSNIFKGDVLALCLDF